MWKIEAVQGDITRQKVDAIVNAANDSLRGGGGVDGAIHRAAGPDLLDECELIGGCPTGEAVMTKGYRLLARHVIHTVGPVWQGGNRHEPEFLKKCYLNSLKVAARNGLKSVAFPAISTGAYAYPLREATKIAVETVREYLKQPTSVQLVRFVCYKPADLAIYQEFLGEGQSSGSHGLPGGLA